jgi:hypothetical protein
MSLVHIDAQIQWSCRKTQSGNWIAECRPLGLTIQSARYSELAEDIGDALDLLFQDLLGSQELDSFLASHGWTRTKEPLQSDAVFDVPFELLMAGKDGSAASLR